MLEVHRLQPCEVRYDDVEIRGLKCTRTRVMWHRTPPEFLEPILEEGLKPSKETGSVSLSSNPHHTYGGEVQLEIDTEGLDLRPICYAFEDDLDKLHELEGKLAERYYKKGEYVSPNRIYDEIGSYPSIYVEECEYTSKKPIPPERIKKVEFWIGWRPAYYNAQVSCFKTSPHWAMIEFEGEWKELQRRLRAAKEAAEKHGRRFEVKSCYRFMEIPCRLTEDGGYSGLCFVELDRENLKRIEEGKKPLVYRGDVRKLEEEGLIGCLCRC